MILPDRIKHFVQVTLGCTCPEEVFRTVDVRRNVPLNSFIALDCVLIVGNRLLIYIADAGTEGCVEEHLPILVRRGKEERDGKVLKRFRLVLVADEPREIRQSADRLFEELRGGDEKVHLHVIKKNDLFFTVEVAGNAE
ncbi:MAG: hypothetical protein HGA73_00050 [Syntrophaceae bacterium]|nr:hypothetical protein [Syntrophaceae bacterium]